MCPLYLLDVPVTSLSLQDADGSFQSAHPVLLFNFKSPPSMAIMTARWIIVICPIHIVALVTDSCVSPKGPMTAVTMIPDYSRRHPAPGLIEMAFVTADPGGSALIVSAVTGGTLGNVLRRCIPVERRTLLIQPRLAERMCT